MEEALAGGPQVAGPEVGGPEVLPGSTRGCWPFGKGGWKGRDGRKSFKDEYKTNLVQITEVIETVVSKESF